RSARLPGAFGIFPYGTSVTFIPFGSEYVSCAGTVNAFGALPGGGVCFGAVKAVGAVGAASCASRGDAWKGSSIAAAIAAVTTTRLALVAIIKSSAPLRSTEVIACIAFRF